MVGANSDAAGLGIGGVVVGWDPWWVWGGFFIEVYCLCVWSRMSEVGWVCGLISWICGIGVRGVDIFKTWLSLGVLFFPRPNAV